MIKIIFHTLIVTFLLASCQSFETQSEICDDGKDNDGDNRYDCADPDCFNKPACQLNINNSNNTNNNTNSGNCGNGIIENEEECDLENLDQKTCLSFGFTGGTLTCNLDCTYNFNNCQENDCLPVFSPCDPESTEECCNPPEGSSSCRIGDGMNTPRCLPDCNDHSDCGWSFHCNNSNFCQPTTCDPDNNGFPSSCTTYTSQNGICLENYVEQESVGFCQVLGNTQTSDSCQAYINYPFGLHIPPDDLCIDGVCLTTDPYYSENPASGICFKYCNPVNSFNGNDECGIGKNCLQYSTIIKDSENPNFLYRTPEIGICVIKATSDEVFSSGIVTCNLINNNRLDQTIGTLDYCPYNTICKPYSSGSFMGYCASHDDFPDGQALKQEAENCPSLIFPTHLGDIVSNYHCDLGMGCIFSDPLNNEFSNYKCRYFCNPYDQEALDCNTKVPGTICKSISELFALEAGLPNSPDGQPSRLGYCVPSESSQN